MRLTKSIIIGALVGLLNHQDIAAISLQRHHHDMGVRFVQTEDVVDDAVSQPIAAPKEEPVLDKGKPKVEPREPSDKDTAEALKKKIEEKEDAKNKDPVLGEDEEKEKTRADVEKLAQAGDRAAAVKEQKKIKDEIKKVKDSPDPKDPPNKKKVELEKKLAAVDAKVEEGKKEVAQLKAEEAEQEAKEAEAEKDLQADKAALKAYEDKQQAFDHGVGQNVAAAEPPKKKALLPESKALEEANGKINKLLADDAAEKEAKAAEKEAAKVNNPNTAIAASAAAEAAYTAEKEAKAAADAREAAKKAAAAAEAKKLADREAASVKAAGPLNDEDWVANMPSNYLVQQRAQGLLYAYTRALSGSESESSVSESAYSGSDRSEYSESYSRSGSESESDDE